MLDPGDGAPAPMNPLGVERLRDGVAPFLLYPLLALLSFPTLGQIVFGQRGLAYAHDVFDIGRTGVLADWLAHGPSLWNTHLTAGNALLAQGNGPYAVDVALGFVVGPFAAYAITAWLLAVVAGISMHLFLRDSLRLSTVATVGGAVVYLFGFWHVVYNAAAPILPLLLWLIDGAMTRGPRRWRFVLAGSIVGAVALYQGIAQLVMLGAAVQLVYVLITSPSVRDLGRRAGTWAATWVLAICMFGPALITQVVMLPTSQRTIWVIPTPPPVEALLGILQQYDPVLLGVPLGGGWGTSPDIYGTYFVGALGLVLVALSIVGPRPDRRARAMLMLLFAIPLADLAGTLLIQFQDQLGFLKSFQVVRVRHLLPFALAANLAIGLDVLVGALSEGRSPIRAGPSSKWRWALVGTVVIPVVVATAVAVGQVVSRRRALVHLETPAIGWGLLGVALIGGLTLIALVAFVLRNGRRGPLPRLRGAVCMVLLLGLIGERAVYAHAERLTGSELGTWADRLGETPAQAFIRAQPRVDTERVLTFGDDANRMGVLELLQADGYQAIYPLTYHAFFDALIAPTLAVDPAMAIYYRTWGGRAITFGPLVDPEIVALDGVRWLYVRGDERPSVPGIVERFRDEDTVVYENPAVLPRAFVVDRIAGYRDTKAVVDAMAIAHLEDLRTTAYLVDGPDAERLRRDVTPASGSDAAGRPVGSASITVYAPDRVEIDVEADRTGVLVLTDVMAPGWVAERDGVAVPITTVDATFRGVAVDPATRSVVFRYVPLFTYAGFGLAGFALIGAVGWAALVRRRDGRRDPFRSTPAPATPS